jgi:hypothetical protein
MKFSEQQLIFYASAFAALLISRIPRIGKFFRSTNTLIHESGHALVTLFTSGNVVSIDLNSDTSGAATTESRYWLFKILIALAGYVFSSATAFLLFYLISKAKYTWVFYTFCAFALVNLIFWVRNAYGIFWLLIFSGILVWVLYYNIPNYMYATSVFFSALVLFESVFSAATVCWISMNEPSNSGDATLLRDFTYIPAPIWGMFFLAQAVYFAYLTILLFV